MQQVYRRPTHVRGGLAALNRTGVAVARRDGCGSSTRGGDRDSGSRGFTSSFRNGSRRGDRKGEESEEGVERDDGELEDHGCGKL